MGFAAIKVKTSDFFRRVVFAPRVIQTQIISSSTAKAKGTHFATLLDEYSHWLEASGLMSSTVWDYTRRVKFFFKIAEITDIEELTEELVLRVFEDRKYSPITRRMRLCALRMFCELAKIKGILTTNPIYETRLGGKHARAAETRIPNVDLKKIDIAICADDMNEGNVKDMVSCRKTQADMATKLVLATGIRHSELRNICGSDIDTSKEPHDILITIRGKGARNRVVSLNKNIMLCTQICALKSKVGKERLFYKLPVTSFGRDIWKSTTKLLGMRLSPHQLRHCCAHNWCYEHKLSITSICSMLGHTNIQTTHKYLDRRKSRALQEISSLNQYRMQKVCSPGMDAGINTI